MKNTKISKVLYFFTRNTTSETVKHKFWHWLLSSNQREEKESVLREIWEMTEVNADKSTQNSLLEVMHKAGMSSQSASFRPFSIRKIARVAAMLAIPLFTALGAWLYVQDALDGAKMVECFTLQGEQKQVVLPDGTTVLMNSESFIVYPKRFRGAERAVYLSGEANFDVYKDPKHPFIVKTSQLSIQALGTKFNVQAYPDLDKEVTTLENGLVKITNKIDSNKVFFLQPDEQLEYDQRVRAFEKRKTNAALASGWMKGELNLVNYSFKDVVAALQRHYLVKIKVDPLLYTSDLYTIKIKSGETLEQAVKIVALTVGGVTADFKDSHTIVLTASASLTKKGGAVR